MGCDVVLARSQATVGGAALFGCNRHGLPDEPWLLEQIRRPARTGTAQTARLQPGAGA